MVQSSHIMTKKIHEEPVIRGSFADLGLSTQILEAVEKKGFIHPSPIQSRVIPLLLTGSKDIIGQAHTGTGKTAAFALPLLDLLDSSVTKTQSIILVPTRELAIQVAHEITSFSIKGSPTVEVIYGGNNIRNEISALKRNPHIVVGTPGRIQHHIRNKDLKLDHIQYFILDEADEMLNFGFRSEIESILGLCPTDRRVLLFSATMSPAIMGIVEQYMHEYDMVKVISDDVTNTNITQKYYVVDSGDRFDALCRVMEVEETFYSIIFCRTKREVDALTSQLKLKHLDVEAIHGDIDQKKREDILRRFKTGQTKLLVATDVAARGIDVSELNFVVNYSIPESYDTYTHRIGRTGRAGNTGTALTFVTPAQVQKLRFFERNLRITMEKGVLPEPKDIILRKQQHLIEKIERIINNENLEHVLPIAQQLLDEGDALTVIAALLKTSYSDEFNEKSYTVINTTQRGVTSSRTSTSSKNMSYRRNRTHETSGYKKEYKKKSSSSPSGRISRKNGTTPSGEGVSKKKSSGGRVGGGSARKFSVSKKKYTATPRGPKQYAGGKK